MEKNLTCFIRFSDRESVEQTINILKDQVVVKDVVIVGGDDTLAFPEGMNVSFLKSDNFASSATLKQMAAMAETPWVLVYSGLSGPPDPGKYSLNRMIQACRDTGAGMVYSDYYERRNNTVIPYPLIDYQEGSLRDDFNFGPVILYNGSAFRNACARMEREYKFAGLYDLRLKISQDHPLLHLPEYLYTVEETDKRKSGEKQHDYVDPRNRAVQIEMEFVCTDHLKEINAWLKPVFDKISFREEEFENEASVIIPVRNRVKTIGDAIASVLSQEAPFSFNLIVVDNHSTDGTTELIKSFAQNDKRLIHHIPDRKDLGIGGCWNEGIFHPECGKFSIQLDSDDLYIDNSVIVRIVDSFYSQQCAMVIGSYQMVNFDLEEIPPGLIDHSEWTPENGRNNALRINGLGAPRAFYTPVIRRIGIPDVSYGEDYAAGLAVSRSYQIGRIYESLYLCRRWEGNTDAALDIASVNAHNLYKDRIRTMELMARKKLIEETK
ncbi:MAG: glycosyltransferase family 2 protein [Bacteroidales bacterium]|nr:glycosyltransferase family 2 protein [Bacteroidales bacterium]